MVRLVSVLIVFSSGSIWVRQGGVSRNYLGGMGGVQRFSFFFWPVPSLLSPWKIPREHWGQLLLTWGCRSPRAIQETCNTSLVWLFTTKSVPGGRTNYHELSAAGKAFCSVKSRARWECPWQYCARSVEQCQEVTKLVQCRVHHVNGVSDSAMWENAQHRKDGTYLWGAHEAGSTQR